MFQTRLANSGRVGTPPLELWAIAPLSVLVFVLPFAHVTAIRSVAYILVLLAAIYLVRKQGWLTPPLMSVFALWIFSAGVSLIGAANFQYSVQQIKADILYSLLAYFSAFSVVRDWNSFRLVRLAGIMAMSGMSVVAIASYWIHGYWLISFQNSLGFFTTSIITLMPLCLSVFLPGKLLEVRGGRIFAGVAFAAADCACYLAGSRATWPILLLVPVLYWLHASGRNRAQNAMVIVAVCACVVFLAFLSAIRTGKEFNIEDRIPIYKTAIREIGVNLPTGTGFGRESNRGAYRDAIEKDKSIRHSHSLLLSYPEQMGILGAVTVILMFWWLLRAFLQEYRRDLQHEKMLGLAGVALTMSVLLKSTTDMFFTGHNLVLFWAQCGVLLGIAAHLRSARAAASRVRG